MTEFLGSKMAALPGRRRIEVLDQAIRKVAEKRPCGQEWCSAKCWPCVRAALLLADVLAQREHLDDMPTEAG